MVVRPETEGPLYYRQRGYRKLSDNEQETYTVTIQPPRYFYYWKV